MTAVRFEIRNAEGSVEVDNGMLSAPEHTDPADVAREILHGAPPGWQVRLWHDVDLIGPLDALGEPDAVVQT